MKFQALNRKFNKTAVLSTFFLLFTCVQFTCAQSPTPPPGNYYTSWLGNTFMEVKGQKVVTEELNSISVSPNGIVFSAGYAETGGGGASFNASDGSFAGRYAGSNTGFGDPLGTVGSDNNYVYYGTSGYGILRAAHGGTSGTYTKFLSGKNIQGLYAKNGKLFVSDFGDGKIRILNTSTMAEESSFACASPTNLTVDKAGNIWVIIWTDETLQNPTGGPYWWGGKVKSFSPAGVPGPEITDFEGPRGIAVDTGGCLLLGGMSENGQIWKYDVTGTPTKVGTFGADKGIFGGVAGAITDSAKLHWVRSIAVDADNNIYTGSCYGTFWGGVIEKWNPGGKLIWRDFAGTSLDCAGIDPDNETEVYSKFHHYSLDYSKRTPGTEWSLKGFTVNRFKYPNDNRVDVSTDVQVRSLGAGAYRIGGKLFMARSRQYGYQWELYRQETSTDGEVLVPSVKMGNGGDHFNHFYNTTTKTWFDKPVFGGLYNAGWHIANNGDIFTMADNPDFIIQYKFQGFDEFNNPKWDAEHATKTASPMDYDARRLYYDSDEDVMYIAGDEPAGDWDNFLKIKRFENWSEGNRTPGFTATLPYDDNQYTPGTGYGGGRPTAFTVAGDYMFVLYGYGHIRILNKTDGELVGTLVQNVNGWHGSGGQVDAPYSLTAFKRLTGEYIFFFENAAWANIMMQRWCPDGTCSEVLTPLESVKLLPDTLNVYGTGTGTLQAGFFPNDASNKNVTWTSSNPAVAVVIGNPQSSCKVTGITTGSCFVRVTAKDGNKTDSTLVVVNNLPVSGINVLHDSINIGVGRNRQLNAIVLPATATNKKIGWESSDTTVVKVDSSGMLTAIEPGSTYVKSISADGGFKDSCKVIVTIDGSGLKGDYYNTNNLTGPIMVTRIDPNINFNFADVGDGSYANGGPIDNFSARWTGQVIPLYSENYNFCILCDEGGRLWINGGLLVDGWYKRGETLCDSIELTKGIKYNIKMEYYEKTGGAGAFLYWKSPSQAYEIVPQDQMYPSYTIIPATSLTVSPDSLTLLVGNSQTLTYTIFPDNATNGAISWSSDNLQVATVSYTGKVIAKNPGVANISITNEDESKTATCVVTVLPINTASADVSSKSKFLVFPNPGNGDKITISGIAAHSIIEICDLSGEVLIKKVNKLENEMIITNLNLNKGFYLISVENESDKSTEKLIIE
jgi:uncharacterized protein YjdB